MAVQPSSEDLRLLKDKIFLAARDNQPDVIQDCLASLHPDVVKDVLHHCSEFQGLQRTPLNVAAYNGHLEVVELLVNEFNVYVNKKNSCSYEMYSALISAVSKGHLEIVKVLVKKGCDICSASENGKAAMYVAFRENQVNILKYLDANGGVLEKHMMTYAFKNACRRGPTAMLEFLLSKGVDPNNEDVNGTLLHMAARRDEPDRIRLFLQHGARFTKDEHGRSPLMEAALHKSSNAVKVFLESADLSELEKIEGLELLGAAYAETNVDKAFQYIRQAKEKRCKIPNADNLKLQSPLPTLSKVYESQTVEELQARRSNQHLFRLECLAILNRVLGPNDRLRYDACKAYSDELRSSRRHREATAILLHGVKVSVKCSTNPMLTRRLLLNLSCEFVQIMQDGIFSMFSDFEGIMESTMEMAEKDKSIRLETLADDDVWLSYILIALKVAQGQEEGRRLQRLTERFIRLSPGSTVLHVAVSLYWIRPFYLQTLDHLPYDLLVSFLLQCGLDVYVKDENKDTPLHTIARLSRRRKGRALINRVTKILLAAGALVSVKNRKGQTPLDLADPALAAELRELYPVSLKSLAATVVVGHKIPYVEVVPKDLADFTEKH